jgi:hypothetical protein
MLNNILVYFFYIQKPESPIEFGYCNVYIREPTLYGHRRSIQRFRFPAARYNRYRLRMYLLNLSFSLKSNELINIAFTGPFMSFRLNIPVFVHPPTAQTIIRSPRGSSEYLYFKMHNQ